MLKINIEYICFVKKKMENFENKPKETMKNIYFTIYL